jgi:acetolactate synthase-1/3 small subunit
MDKKHVISVLVENKAGVLTKVTGLFARRGYNIDSLAVGETEKSDTSRITVIVSGDDHIVDQICKQLQKLINVITVRVLDDYECVKRELVFIKVKAVSAKRSEIIQFVDIFRANVIDVSAKTMTIEISGDSDKINALKGLLEPFGILEIVRTGMIAVQRGIACVEGTEEKKQI